MFFPGINAFLSLARLSPRSFPQASDVDVSLFSSVRPQSTLQRALSRFEHAHSKHNIEPAIAPSTANCLRGFRCVLLASKNFFKLEMSRREKQTTNSIQRHIESRRYLPGDHQIKLSISHMKSFIGFAPHKHPS